MLLLRPTFKGDAGTDENVWYLLDYQKGQGLPQAIVRHIRAGIEQAQKDPESLLIFSGGETRASTGPLTEGSSYFRVADAMDLWPEDDSSAASSVRARTVTEEFATDSFENFLFSICRFKEVTGMYPSEITVVSFSFKQRRLLQLLDGQTTSFITLESIHQPRPLVLPWHNLQRAGPI
jgi:hypothetical protein